VVNAGSSSIRVAVYRGDASPRALLAAKLERVGTGKTTLVISGSSGAEARSVVRSRKQPINSPLVWLQAQPCFPSITAAGHRVVHGGPHVAREPITSKLLVELRTHRAFDPEHAPREIELIEKLRRLAPQLPQLACFDTAFHRAMPRVAKLLAIPRRYLGRGVRRYGFHGLSYAFMMEELARLGEPASKSGRIILAHLRSVASLSAVRNGRGIDTSMGFTPAAGLMMGTRAGDLDPGLMTFLARSRGLTPKRPDRMVNRESGLLGVLETSADLRDLLARERRDLRALDAVALFCHQAKKWIGAYAAALGGVDTLVFSGGIGENAPVIRDRICAGLGFLGIRLSGARNARSAAVISAPTGRVRVRVIRTDEELMIARAVRRWARRGFPR